jgi:lipoprotein NlpI
MMHGDLAHALQELTQRLVTAPQSPTVYIQRGMVYFKRGEIAAAIDDFDTAEQLDASLTPYLWQRGLAYYYAGRFAEGVKQFTVDLTVNAQDVEETVWRYLCQAQLHGAQAARTDLYPVRQDSRAVMQTVYQLFAGECEAATVLAQYDGSSRRNRMYSHLYVGLYYEAHREAGLARRHITHAAELQVVDDYMGWVAMIHRHLRGWDKP